MYPVLRNTRGSLMRKCDSDQQALAVGMVYHFYVDETAATNGDGTEVNPWNSINNAFNTEIHNRCLQPCTKVYVHISGSIQYGIGYSVDRPVHLIQDYMLNLIFVPWKQDRVAVNPGLNYLSPPSSNQVVAYCRGVEYRNFDFIQHAHPSEYNIGMACIYGHNNLYDCTINMFIDGNAVTSTTVSGIIATPLKGANIVINSTINVYADYENSDTNKVRVFNIDYSSINSTIDTTYSYTITGNYKDVTGNCMLCFDKIIGVTIEVNIDIDNSIYSDGRVSVLLVQSLSSTSIKNSNFSVTAKSYYNRYSTVYGVVGVVKMHSSNIYVSAISTIASGELLVCGFKDYGELVDCSITAIASANTILYSSTLSLLALGIRKPSSDSLLIDSCIISASASLATWPPTETTHNRTLHQLQCALFASFNSLNTAFIIDSDLSSGSCLSQKYSHASGTITDDPTWCTSENNYPASCILGE